MSSNDKSLIAGMMEGFVSDAPAKPFVSFCVFCNKGVIKEEMTYQKGKVLHTNCFNKHGSSYPSVNQELLSESTNAKVQLVQLKNLKIRMEGKSNSETKKPKTKRRVTKKRRTSTKRKKIRRSSRKKKRVAKKRVSPKRRKTSRKPKRRVSRRIKRKTRRRR